MANPRERWTGQSAYDPEKTPEACYLAFIDSKGFSRTDAQVASILGVSKQTLWEWRSKHPEFKLAYQAGKTDAEAAYSKAFIEKSVNGEPFTAPWVTFMFIRQFGHMADIERDAGESDDERINDYTKKINALKDANKKNE